MPRTRGLLRRLPALAASALAAAVPVPGASETTYDFPDPSVLSSDGGWWAYATKTGWEPRGHAFPVLRSADLTHWTRVGDALASPPRWAAGDFWGPSVIAAGGHYLLYYSARERGGRDHCLAVATALRPGGPFTDRGPIACGDPATRGYIDPAPLRDDDGSLYLYFSVDGPAHGLAVVALTPDGLAPAGPAVALLGIAPWERGLRDETVEAPTVTEHDGLYFLLYSAGSWRQDYRMGYALAASPLGPFVDAAANPVLTGGSLTAPGGGSVFDGPGGPWLAYHAWTGPTDYRRGGRRTLRLAPLAFSRDQLAVVGPGGQA